MAVDFKELMENPKAKVIVIGVGVLLVLGLAAFAWFGSGPTATVSNSAPIGKDKATIVGTVIDNQGKPVPNLQLKIQWATPDAADRKPYSATTDAQGKFKVEVTNGQFSIQSAQKTYQGSASVLVDSNQEATVQMTVRKK